MATKKPTIQLGDPQPLDCPKCKEKHGYSVSDTIRTAYTTHYNQEGEMTGGAYSDHQPILRHGKTASCWNCNAVLPFFVDRTKDDR